MRLLAFFLVAVLALPVMSGCSHGVWTYPGRSRNFQSEIDSVKSYLDVAEVVKAHESLGNPAQQKTYRNQVIQAHIYIIDLWFHEREKRLLWGAKA